MINVKPYPYGIEYVLRHYQYRSDPKLGCKIVTTRIILCSCHVCKTKLYTPWDSTIKEACNQPKYERLYNCSYFLIIGFHNKCIIMSFIYYVIDNAEYLYNYTWWVMNMYLIINKVKHGAIDDDDT